MLNIIISTWLLAAGFLIFENKILTKIDITLSYAKEL